MESRILYLIGQLGMGGTERQLLFLLRGLDRSRYQPAVAVWNFDEQDHHVDLIRALGVPLYSLSGTDGRVGRLLRLRRLISHLRAEVVHSFSFYTNFAAWWGALGTRSVPIGSIRSDFGKLRRNSGPLLGPLNSRWPRHQLCNSRTAARQALSLARPLGPERVTVVWNGIDFDGFAPAPPPAGGPARIVAVGSLFAVKRRDRLLAAAAALARRGVEFQVRIAGEGPQRGELHEKIRSLGLEDRVFLLSSVNDVPKLLSESSFLVHTSEIEGCPNAVLEAMAGARAVVACSAGDIPEIVEQGRTGFVVRPDDLEGLVASMLELIERPERCREMGLAGRAKAEREFRIPRMVDETLAVYRAAGWREA